MTNTNLPPEDDQANVLRRTQITLMESQNRLQRNLIQSLKTVGRSFERFANPLTRFQDSIQRLDQTNREALKVGVTNEKLTREVSKNTNILSRGLVSTQKLQSAIIDNFGQGVRFQTEGLMNLTQEMIATGQNVQALSRLNSDLVLFTGENIKVIDNLAQVNEKVSNDYGVSNDRLINTMQSLRESMEVASFFGSNTVESLATVAMQLTGRAGGTNIQGALNTLNRILVGGFETVQARAILGATNLGNRLTSGGTAGLQDVIPILARVNQLQTQVGGGAFGLDIVSNLLGVSKNQVAQLTNLFEISQRDFKVQDEVKKTQDETLNNIQNMRERAVNFYDNTAVASLGMLGRIDTHMMTLVLRGGLVGAGGASLVPMRRAGDATPGSAGLPPGLMGSGPQARPGKYSVQSIKNTFAARGGFKGTALRGIGGLGIGLGTASLIGAAVPGASDFSNTLNFAGLGAGIGSMIPIPGVGTAAGAVGGAAIGFLMDIKENTLKSAEAEKKQAEIAEEKRRQESYQQASMDIDRINFLVSYVRSRSGFEGMNEDGNSYMRDIAAYSKRIAENSEGPRTTAGGKPK